MPTVQHQLGAVFDDPLDGFTAREFQRLGQGGREVDVPLLTGFALNELDFGGVTHVVSLSSYITRYQNTPQCFDPARVFIPLARSRPLKCGNLSSQTPNSRGGLPSPPVDCDRSVGAQALNSLKHGPEPGFSTPPPRFDRGCNTCGRRG